MGELPSCPFIFLYRSKILAPLLSKSAPRKYLKSSDDGSSKLAVAVNFPFSSKLFNPSIPTSWLARDVGLLSNALFKYCCVVTLPQFVVVTPVVNPCSRGSPFSKPCLPSRVTSSEMLPSCSIILPPVRLGRGFPSPESIFPLALVLNGSINQNSTYSTFALSKSTSLRIAVVIPAQFDLPTPSNDGL